MTDQATLLKREDSRTWEGGITMVQGKSGPFGIPPLTHFQVPFWVHFWFIFRSIFDPKLSIFWCSKTAFFINFRRFAASYVYDKIAEPEFLIQF